jgi:hypothetical protein
MSHQVLIMPGLTNVDLPNGGTYQGGQSVWLDDEDYSRLSATVFGTTLIDAAGQTIVTGDTNTHIWSQPILLSSIANGSLPVTITPGYAGTITGWQALVTTPVTTAAKLSTLGLLINATAVGTTPTTLALTSAAATPAGKVIAGSAVAGANIFDNNDILTVTAASTTTFVEGRILLQVFFLAS